MRDDWLLRQPGFPIRRSPDQSLFSGSPKLFAANRVLLRLSAPRHPPFALISLTNPLKATGSSQVLASLLLNPYSVVKEHKAHRALNTRLISPSVSYSILGGGGERDRTDDLLRARQALSQLSYTPASPQATHLVGLGRVELPTSRLSGVRSNRI